MLCLTTGIIAIAIIKTADDPSIDIAVYPKYACIVFESWNLNSVSVRP